MRTQFVIGSGLIAIAIIVIAIWWPPALWAFALFGPLILLGIFDCLQSRHAVLRNYPVLGHFRYLFEMIRPEINQYFVESETDGVPFNRELRSVVYQRSKNVIDTVPFGTKRDVYEVGHEWINHSLHPRHIEEQNPRVRIGEGRCAQPYDASIFNISAMSFGSLSRNAVRALNWGAKLGGFAHNTGEGGVSPYHLEHGGDLIWQIGTGYFGCRNEDGSFADEPFAKMAQHPHIKMIEVKLSQGAKPGHGGILPGRKVTPEIARIRLVPLGKDVISPPAHSAFDNPSAMLEWIKKLRELSGGKPVGIKLCVGDKREFLSICRAMLDTGLQPDFIAVDGAEGGTGAAPLEFSNSIGMPLNDGLVFVHNALVGAGLRDEVRIMAAGKIITGFHLATKLALGADLVYSARGMMFALGCIQALRCNTNHCPVGIATQRDELVDGLVVEPKAERVRSFHDSTVESFLELLGAAGLERPEDLKPWHIYRRTTECEVRHYAQIYDFLDADTLLSEPFPKGFARAWSTASPTHW